MKWSTELYLMLQWLGALRAIEFPRRFSAVVVSNQKTLGCGGLPIVSQVQQDVGSAKWTRMVNSDGVHSSLEDVLYTVPAATADPDTPEASALTRFSWRSDTNFQDCSYGLYYYEHRMLPLFFGYPTTFLEAKESIDGVVCEKWSNRDKAGPYDTYWAVWYPINAHPPYSKVLKAQYYTPPSRPNMFPVPSCTLDYNFTRFTTDAIPPLEFVPPPDWTSMCTNSAQGLRKARLPGRQDGYVCVAPNKTNSFTISLQAKPVQSVTVKLRPCTPQDYCINGARCKDCVRFSTTTLTFGPHNWATPQTIGVAYEKDGDSQFVFESPDSFLNNTYSSQFSTCACTHSRKCTNNCQLYCGT